LENIIYSDFIKPCESENYIIEHFFVPVEYIDDDNHIMSVGSYIKLLYKHVPNKIIMSTTEYEIDTNNDFAHEAYGDVLIGGLGLGVVLLLLRENIDVKHVTVIEKEREIIDLVWRQLQLDSRFNIIHGDCFYYTPNKKFDCMYFDIWEEICASNCIEMELLNQKYTQFLKSTTGFISHWVEAECYELADSHGGCPYCQSKRRHKNNKRELGARQKIAEV